jgi:DNA modification methylase
MATPELQKSGYLNSNAGKYAHACLSSLPWWDNLKRIMDSIQSLYVFLRFADQEGIPNFSDILFRYHILRQEYDALFHDDRTSFDQYMEIVNKRMHDVANATYMNAGKMN